MNTTKNTTLILLLLACSMLSRAQHYSFSYSQQTYTPITAGTSLTNGIVWDDPEFILPIGFDFTAINLTSSEILFDEGSGGIPYIDSAQSDYIFFAAYGHDLVDRAIDYSMTFEGDSGGVSDISYVLEGTAGSRIFKMQWTNAGFYQDLDLDSVAQASIDYQIWLYESSNIIEYHYGPTNIPIIADCFEGFPGPITGVYRGPAGDFTEIHELENSPTMPTLKYTTISNDISSLGDTIPEGMVYRFTPVTLGVKNFSSIGNVEFYPNPTNSKIQITNIDAQKIESIEVWNAVGQRCMQLESTSEIDLSAQSAGVYMIRVLTSDGSYTGTVTRD